MAQKSRDGSDERVVLFLKMAPDIVLSAELIRQIQMSIRKELSARHVPAVVLETSDIPVCVRSVCLTGNRYTIYSSVDFINETCSYILI